MYTRRGECNNCVAALNRFVVKNFIAVNYTDSEAGEVVVVIRHHTRMLSGLTADECAVCLYTAFCHARNDFRNFFGNVFAAGNIIEEKQRLCAAANDIVDAHCHTVHADGIVLVEKHCNFQLSADAVSTADKYGIFHTCEIRHEQTAETANVRNTSVVQSAFDMLFHQFNRFVAGGNIYTRRLIAFRKTAFHGF